MNHHHHHHIHVDVAAAAAAAVIVVVAADTVPSEFRIWNFFVVVVDVFLLVKCISPATLTLTTTTTSIMFFVC